MKKPQHLKTGAKGERLALRYLRWRGYALVEKNFKSRRYEIDLIMRARRTGTLVFVEVKTRRENSLTAPYEAVTPQKQHYIRQAATAYLMQQGDLNVPLRFDVAEVFLPSRRVHHIENAF
ncbi:MAG: YraN family protein [Clostridiales bacterium]|nr:YraN family protein [Clostridiales bacterium]